MKQTLPQTKALVCGLIFALISFTSFSQISVASTTGYAVNITVKPTTIVTNGVSSCQWGYGYTVRLTYTLTFTGSNRPSALYNLQGTIGNGNKAIYFDLPETQGTGVTFTSNDYRNESDCATATPTSIGLNTISIRLSGLGIADQTISYIYSATPLGIKLMDFKAIANNNNVDLKWATASEDNNNFFTIERSANGTDWNDVKTVKGAGTSSTTKNYEAIDESPLSGNSYYRLKQTDFDGAVTYSDVKAVKYSGIAKNISIFPVPNAGNTVSFKGISDFKNSRVAVLNASGNTIYTAALTKASIELPVIPTGVYFIRVINSNNGETSNLRYVKI